jgi:hypothetical protein
VSIYQGWPGYGSTNMHMAVRSASVKVSDLIISTSHRLDTVTLIVRPVTVGSAQKILRRRLHFGDVAVRRQERILVRIVKWCRVSLPGPGGLGYETDMIII